MNRKHDAKAKNGPKAGLDVTERVPKPMEVSPGMEPEIVAVINESYALGALPVTMSLQDICDVLGPDINPRSFAHDALVTLAEQLDVISTLGKGGETVEQLGGRETWPTYRALYNRMLLAARLADAIDIYRRGAP